MVFHRLVIQARINPDPQIADANHKPSSVCLHPALNPSLVSRHPTQHNLHPATDSPATNPTHCIKLVFQISIPSSVQTSYWL